MNKLKLVCCQINLYWLKFIFFDNMLYCHDSNLEPNRNMVNQNPRKDRKLTLSINTTSKVESGENIRKREAYLKLES